MLTADDIAVLISRCVTQCIRIDADASRPTLDRANMQQSVIEQTAQDIAAGKHPVWAGEHV